MSAPVTATATATATATRVLHRYTPDGAIFNKGWTLYPSPLERQDSRAKVKPISSTLSSALLVDWLGNDNTKQWRLSTHETGATRQRDFSNLIYKGQILICIDKRPRRYTQ